MATDELPTEIEPLFEGDTPDRRQWLLAISAGMASFLDSAIIVAVSVGLVLIQDEFGLTTWGVGLLSALLTFSIALGSLAGGWLADRFGRMRMFTVYILIYAVGMAIMALSAHEVMLFGGVVVAGLAAGADLPTSVAVVSERAPRRAQGRLVGATALMWSAGILATQLSAFLLADLGMAGIRLIFGATSLLAVATWAVRALHPWLKSLEEDANVAYVEKEEIPKRPSMVEVLKQRAFLVPTALTLVFYVLWGLVANTFGQFQTYFLVTAGGATQSFATGFSALLTAGGVLMAVVYVRIADTRWRNPLFVVGSVLQIVSMVVAGLAGGQLFVYVTAIGIFMLSVMFAGDATYKVWTQEALPIDVRASIQGLTNGIGRAVFGLFALVTPTLLDSNRDGLLWALVAFSTGGLLAGLAVMRFLNSRGLRPGQPGTSVAATRVAGRT